MMSWLYEQAQQRPQAQAFWFDEVSYDFETLGREAQRRAAMLRDRGVGPGDLVGLRAENSEQWVFAAHAVFWLGATLVPLHPRLAESALCEQMEQLSLRLLLVEKREELCPDAETLELDELAKAKPAECQPATWAADQVLTILFTSGTTATPQAVPLTVGNHLASATASKARLGHEPGDHWLCCLPLCHVGGLAIMLRSLFVGASFALLPRFEATSVAQALRTQAVTMASFVPTMVHRLLEYAEVVQADSLRVVLVGGGPMEAETLYEARRRGLPVVPTYGMTEAASQLTTLALSDGEARLTTAGRPLEGVEICILGADAEPLAAGCSGSIAVRGPMLTPGYLRADPGKGRLVGEGWFVTGDVGRLDEEGYLTVEHRDGEVIVTGGENVAPRQVEALLRKHRQVRDVAVVGVDDKEWGQRVAALLVVKPQKIEKTELIQSLTKHCREEAAPFQTPKVWAFAEEIPQTASGKHDRRRVRDLILRDHKQGEGPC